MSKDKHIGNGNSPLLDSLPKLNCFKVPDGYFTRLHQNIIVRVELGEQPFDHTLDALKTQQNFSLPDSYFDKLSARIAAHTTAGFSLETLPKEEGFAVPEAYFDKLYLNVVDRVAETAPARPWWVPATALRPILAFAAVAVVAAVVAWPLLNGPAQPSQKVVADNSTIKVEQPAPAVQKPATQPTIVIPTGPVTPVAQAKAPHKAIQPVSTVNANDGINAVADLYDINDIPTELLLSEVPASEKTDDHGLEQLMLEENIDIADIVYSGI